MIQLRPWTGLFLLSLLLHLPAIAQYKGRKITTLPVFNSDKKLKVEALSFERMIEYFGIDSTESNYYIILRKYLPDRSPNGFYSNIGDRQEFLNYSYPSDKLLWTIPRSLYEFRYIDPDFLFLDRPQNHEFQVFSALDGKMLWMRKNFNFLNLNKKDSIVLGHDLLVDGWRKTPQFLQALDINTGKKKWEIQLPISPIQYFEFFLNDSIYVFANAGINLINIRKKTSVRVEEVPGTTNQNKQLDIIKNANQIGESMPFSYDSHSNFWTEDDTLYHSGYNDLRYLLGNGNIICETILSNPEPSQRKLEKFKGKLFLYNYGLATGEKGPVLTGPSWIEIYDPTNCKLLHRFQFKKGTNLSDWYYLDQKIHLLTSKNMLIKLQTVPPYKVDTVKILNDTIKKIGGIYRYDFVYRYPKKGYEFYPEDSTTFIFHANAEYKFLADSNLVLKKIFPGDHFFSQVYNDQNDSISAFRNKKRNLVILNKNHIPILEIKDNMRIFRRKQNLYFTSGKILYKLSLEALKELD